ncbi:hypothetical protein, partial [Pantoea ananatis]|uniref:hypothetical protein n=1 Tax=Pantoea ananas TaxID=553 RepID=UPI001B30E163
AFAEVERKLIVETLSTLFGACFLRANALKHENMPYIKQWLMYVVPHTLIMLMKRNKPFPKVMSLANGLKLSS